MAESLEERVKALTAEHDARLKEAEATGDRAKIRLAEIKNYNEMYAFASLYAAKLDELARIVL